MSADFRLRDKNSYAKWYGHEHRALQLQNEAVYGLTELYRQEIAAARRVACPGCYPTAVLLGLVPLAKAKLIDVDVPRGLLDPSLEQVALLELSALGGHQPQHDHLAFGH